MPESDMPDFVGSQFKVLSSEEWTGVAIEGRWGDWEEGRGWELGLIRKIKKKIVSKFKNAVN